MVMGMQDLFKKMDPEFAYVAGVFLLSCMIWYLKDDSILGSGDIELGNIIFFGEAFILFSFVFGSRFFLVYFLFILVSRELGFCNNENTENLRCGTNTILLFFLVILCLLLIIQYIYNFYYQNPSCYVF